MDHNLALHTEALIFIAREALSLKEIKRCLTSRFDQKISKDEILEILQHLQMKYQDDAFAFELVEIAGGYKFMSKGVYYETIATYLRQTNEKKLSSAALETLSIVAYKQPVEKSELEKIRGVSCDYTIQKLLEKELVEIIGRSEGPGRPLIYGTSQKFMDYFGLSSIKDLPKLKDFKLPDNVIGEELPPEEEVIDLKDEEE